MKIISELVKISKFAGERFDLVQAGGGNSSVKTPEGIMYIKSSGITLSEVNHNTGFVKLDNSLLLHFFDNLKENDDENKANTILQKAQLDSTAKPSIETFMHSFLSKYVLHTHPIGINIVMAENNWRDIAKKIFPEALLIPYRKPGFELAKEIYYQTKNKDISDFVILLQNHGLIVSANNSEYVIRKTDEITFRCEKYLNIDLSRYKLTNKISAFLNEFSKEQIAYLSEHPLINKFLKERKELFFYEPFCPDVFVYNGIGALEINDNDYKEKISAYQEKFFDIPNIIIYKDLVFFIAKDILKAKKTEDIFLFKLLVSSKVKNYNPLGKEELQKLKNWNAEIYRKNL